jgi:hypothetical protein
LRYAAEVAGASMLDIRPPLTGAQHRTSHSVSSRI